MKMEEYEYINGSIVSMPQEERQKRNEEAKKRREEERKKYNKRLRENRSYNRKVAIQIIGVLLVLGIITVFSSSRNYTMQKKLISINTEINHITESNEALQIQLLKYSALENIENHAEILGMRMATKEDVVTLDLSKNYFQQLELTENIKDESEIGFFSKIMDVLF